MAIIKQAKGIKAAFPQQVKPMLCTLVREPVDREDYLYEIKWDGYRIVAFKKGKNVRLHSRSALNYGPRYPLVTEALQKIKHDCVLDGEMVVLDEQGLPDFNAVQNYNGSRSPIQYMVFDLLWLDGRDLKEIPFTERRKLLAQVLPVSEVLQISETFTDGPGLYAQMLDRAWEGIIAKKNDSPYIEDDRSMLWLKIPVTRIDEFVIGGYAESDKGRAFRSVLFGAYTPEGLKWVGRSGGGFKDKDMPGILKKLTSLKIETSPFYNEVLDTKGAMIHWIKPQLVGLFEYAEMTSTGRIRKPATWKGFRADKNPRQVVLPQEKQLPKSVPEPHAAKSPRSSAKPGKQSDKGKPVYLNKNSTWKRVDQEQKGADWQEMEMQNCNIQVHNVERELWKDVPKAKLILYYHSISKYILPHIKDRPQSLNLKLSTAGGPTDFLKDMENRQPSCARVFTDHRRDTDPVEKGQKRNQIDYLVANNVETLLFMVDTGCVDINPWSSRWQTPEHPDFLWIDLDPSIPKDTPKPKIRQVEDQGFQKAIECAMATQEILEKHKLTGFVKTSGKTGLHIYVPCRGFNNQEVTHAATVIAEQVNKLLPDISTLARTIAHRENKVYIDPQQNYYTKTLAAPYSVRPYHLPLVSTPLEWKEVKPSLDRWAFDINTTTKRLTKKGDVFDVLSERIGRNNRKPLEKIIA